MSIIKHVTLQKIVAHDFRYDPRTSCIRRLWYTRTTRHVQPVQSLIFKYTLIIKASTGKKADFVATDLLFYESNIATVVGKLNHDSLSLHYF